VSVEPLWITEDEVVSIMSLPEAIPALEKTLALEARGGAFNMTKSLATWGVHHSTLHATGAVVDGAGTVGVKSWAHTEGGACPLLNLYSSETGELLAIIEAFALGQMRTSGISGVATNAMAARDADDMGLVGTGRQSLPQVAAVHAVRPLKRLRVFSPNAENRAAYVAKARKLLPFEVIEAPSAEAAIEGASIVTLVTRAKEPFVTAKMLARGAHLNAVGAIAPDRQEFAQDVFGRVGLIGLDSVDSVQRLSREFQEQFGPPGPRWERCRPLSSLVSEGKGRPAGIDITLFKAMGMGLSDLALGTEILARCRAAGIGRSMPQPKKAQPRLF
jgi:ornithine cyclodeaminase